MRYIPNWQADFRMDHYFGARCFNLLLSAWLMFAILSVNCFPQAQQSPRAIDLNSSDGTPLKASYYAAAKPGPGVLLFHQSNRDRKSWDGVARQLAAAGVNVLTVDGRGHGESAGKTKEAERWWPEDLEPAFDYLLSQPGVKRDVIGAGGAGVLGVENAVELARRHSAQMKSLVLLSGETVRPGLEFLHQASQLPELFVTDDNDEYPPTQEAMQLLYASASSPGKKLIHYAAAEEAPWLWYEPFDIGKVSAKGGHGTDMFQMHAELPGIIVHWFETTLLKTPGQAPADAVAAGPLLADVEFNNGMARAEQQLMEARKKDPQVQLWPEISMSIVAQDYQRAHDFKNAIAIFRLNLLAYPDSADANESLAEAYLANGEKQLARKLAEKSLTLLATPGIPASSWTNTDEYRGEIRKGAQHILDQL
jgi:pimeloyl-ACP methyl ester carboxylesterase